MPGATTLNKTWNLNPSSSPIRVAVIESNLRVSGHACTVFHIMLEDDKNHFSLVRFISDFNELDKLLQHHFPKYRIPLPKLIDVSTMKLKKKKSLFFNSMKKSKKSNSQLLEHYIFSCIHSQIGYSSLFRDFLSAQRDEDRIISKLTVRQLVAQHHVTQEDKIEVIDNHSSIIRRHQSMTQFPEYNSQEKEIQEAGDDVSEFDSYTSSIYNQHQDMYPIQSTTKDDRIDDFQLIKVLGKGATGKVILVRDQVTDKLFALKTITKSWNITQREVDHIKMERDILATLTDIHHPFLVRLHSAFQDYQNLYLVLDYHAGADLATLLQRYICFPPEQCRLYAAEIIMGLQELHRNNILYRDLKPENVLLAADGHLILTDFGLSKMFADEDKYEHRTTTFCGTPEYLAPEIILQEEEYSYAADFWSLGTMLYEMLTGVTPFAANTMDEMYDRVLYDDLLFPAKFDPEAMDLIAGLLERDPLNRLGAGFGGVFELRTHTYFSAHLNWKDVHAKKIQPIYIPKTTSETDLSNFDPDFLNMSTHIKEENDEAILLRRKWLPDTCPAGLYEHAYRGFSYIDVNSDEIPYQSEISFFSDEYMLYDEDEDDMMEDDYNYSSFLKGEQEEDRYYNNNSVPPFLHQQQDTTSSSSASTSCSSSAMDIVQQKKPLKSINSNRSMMMSPSSFNYNQNIRNSLVINASVKDDIVSALRS